MNMRNTVYLSSKNQRSYEYIKYVFMVINAIFRDCVNVIQEYDFLFWFLINAIF
jgi:hypothetical protein